MASLKFPPRLINSSVDFPPDFQNYLGKEDYIYQQSNKFWSFYTRCGRLFNLANWKSDYWIPKTLVQFWKAIPKDGRCLLTTQGQPFVLYEPSEALCSYRLACKKYEFYGDNKGEEEGRLGIPGRVFKYRLVESTPNVLHYTIQEYPQRDEALCNGIKHSFAFPLFEVSNEQCVGVLELLSSLTEISSFDLSDMLDELLEGTRLGVQRSNGHSISHRGLTSLTLDAAYEEIEMALYEAYKNPAVLEAQAWEPCNDCKALYDKDATDTIYLGLRRRMFDKNILDQFRHLDNWWRDCIQEGQGIAGMAFSSRKLSLCTEISQVGIIDYPLKHYAVESGWNGSFAICLHCNYNGNYVFVLEFSFKYDGDARTLISQVWKAMKEYLPSFRATFGQELGEELPILIIDSQTNNRRDFIPIPGEREQVQQPSLSAAIAVRNDVIQEQRSNPNSYSQEAGEIKTMVRQHRKSGIPISLKDIKQQSGKKLDDAAESMGVGRSTFKRACREYGISWWQSGKRKRDNPSNFCGASVREVAQGQVSCFTSSLKQPLELPMASNTSRMQHSMPLEIVNNVSNVNIKVNAPVVKVTQNQVSSFTISSSLKEPHEPPLALDNSRMQHFIPLEIGNNVDIKVFYGEKFAIRFQLSFSSKVEELQQEVVRRLKWVSFRTHILQYIDEDNDWILIGCDDDLQQYMSSSTSSGTATITLHLKPLNSFTLLGSQ